MKIDWLDIKNNRNKDRQLKKGNHFKRYNSTIDRNLDEYATMGAHFIPAGEKNRCKIAPKKTTQFYVGVLV